MLHKIPEVFFEAAGTICGLVACASIAAQVATELVTKTPSTESTTYAVGFLIIFIFWTLYGLRFKRPALWITNGMAVMIQSMLLVVIVTK